MPFIVREMTEADVPAVAALHVATFNETHTRNNDGPSYALRERQWRTAFDKDDGSWFGIVIENEKGELIGFAKGTPHNGGVPGFSGELNKIYLLRRYHRQGLGRALLCEVASRFLSRGIDSMLLFGDAASPSNPFYEAMGAERIFSERGEFHGGYGWRDLRQLAHRCAQSSGRRVNSTAIS
jgi:L-amino acid N-acyltransferase YncA